ATVLFFHSPQVARAAVFNIANGDVFGLNSAIVTANSNHQDDIINLAAGGTYTISAVDNTTKGPSGLAVIRGEGAGATSYSLTINGNGATISRSTSPGTPDFRIFTIDWDQNSVGAIVIVSNLTISNGRISTGTAGDGIS